MNEESKKIEKIEQSAKSAELSEQDLDNVAGGVTGNDGGCIKRPPILPPTKNPGDLL
jgi:hypothetical protein